MEAEGKGIVLEKKRWLMVLLFSALTLVNNMIWLSFGSVANSAQNFFQISAFEVDLASMEFLATSMLFMLVGSWLMDNKGIHHCVRGSATLNMLGSWIRCASYFFSPPVGYWFVLAGGFVVALGQPVLLVGPPKVAAVWFGEKERTIATSISSLSGLVGMALSYGMSPLVVKEGKDFYLLFGIHAIVATVTSLLSIIFFREKPASPPSVSSVKNQPESFLKSFKTAFREKGFILLSLGFGLGFGVFNAMFTIIDQVVEPEGYTEGDAGIFGVVLIMAGIVGAAVFGPIVDKWRNYKTVMIICFSGTVAALTLVYLCLYTEFIPHKVYILGIILGVAGTFAIALLPIAMEAAVEVTYPMPEATVTGLLLLIGSTFAVIEIVVSSLLQQANGRMMHSMLFLLSSTVLSTFFVFFFGGPYKRYEYEKQGYSRLN